LFSVHSWEDYDKQPASYRKLAEDQAQTFIYNPSASLPPHHKIDHHLCFSIKCLHHRRRALDSMAETAVDKVTILTLPIRPSLLLKSLQR